MAVSLDSGVLDQFNTTEAKVLHDITDSLSIRGVGRIVNLPQIIVVGGQSTGKSSVLEAISHVRFPIAGGLCTRFATELVLRQASENRVNVSIKFASKAKAQHVFQRTGFSEESLPDIIQEAREQMGLSQNGRDFSKDVLRLEIEGPGMYPLTLVDLPGLFQVNTDDQSLQGKDTVDQLVGSYLRQENSIILVVIDATTQLANHGSLLMVKKHDPGRERTLGVITKPDCTRPGDSQERTYIQVAKNEERTHKLTLGWHVLRNRAEDETSLDTRDAKEEEFFRTTAWSSIPERNLGAASLRKKLSAVLYQHIRNRLPGVIADIELNLRERQEELDRLGIARSTPAEMRSFLLGIASEFQRLARDGIDGRYNDSFFGDLDSRNRKMRSQIRNLNRVFAWTLETKGASQTISGVSRGTGDDVKDVSLPAHLEAYLVNSPYDFPSPEAVTLKEITPRLQWQAAANQGRELPGVPNKELARQLFQKQAAPWKGIAEFHVGRVTQVAKFFADEIFVHIIGSPEFNRTTDAILSNCVDSFFAEKEALIQLKVKELLHPYSQGYAMPLDDDFYRALSGKSVEHVADRALKNLTATHPGLFEDEAETKLNRSILIEAMSSGESVAAGEFETEKVIDMMQTYYEMSLRTFTDNIINLAVESCLICHLPSILTPVDVDAMPEEKLSELAGEPEDAKSRRKQLQEEMEALRHGLAKCRQYRPRAVTSLPSSHPGSAATHKAASATASPQPKTSPQSTASPQPTTPKLMFANVQKTQTTTGSGFKLFPFAESGSPPQFGTNNTQPTTGGLFKAQPGTRVGA